MARSVRELASSFPCRFGYSPQSSPHFPPFARMRNESTLIVRNYAQERRDPCEKFYASRLYRYLVRLRRFYRSGSADQSVADAAIVSHRHFRADQSMADAAIVSHCHFRADQSVADAAIVSHCSFRAHQSVADAAIVSHCSFRADQSMADAAGAIDLVVFGISSINNRRKQRE